jgi:hypothetical protein
MRLLGHDVHVRKLNLSLPWQEIERAIHDLVEVLAATESGEAIHPRAAAV